MHILKFSGSHYFIVDLEKYWTVKVWSSKSALIHWYVDDLHRKNICWYFHITLIIFWYLIVYNSTLTIFRYPIIDNFTTLIIFRCLVIYNFATLIISWYLIIYDFTLIKFYLIAFYCCFFRRRYNVILLVIMKEEDIRLIVKCL